MLVFTNIILMECWFRYLALFLLYSVIYQSGLHKNIQLMLEFFKDWFLVLHFSYYTLISTLNVIRHIIELTCEVESDIWDTVDLFFFYQFINTCAIDVKMDGSVLEEKSSFKILGLTFSSKLDRGSYIISVAKSVSK